MTLQGAMGTAMVVEGGTDAKVFETYVEHFLAPSLSAGQIVLLDNLGAHKTQRVRELVEARGAEVWFLPAYSPDLNPIEEAFSKVKALLKKAAARTKGMLVDAIARALASVTTQDAWGWFVHSGYKPKDLSLCVPLSLSAFGCWEPARPRTGTRHRRYRIERRTVQRPRRRQPSKKLKAVEDGVLRVPDRGRAESGGVSRSVLKAGEASVLVPSFPAGEWPCGLLRPGT